MEARLLSGALLLLSKHPINAISVNDLITQENVSRGTFYKYFDSLAQIFLELHARLDAELTPIGDQLILGIPDPAVRMAVGTRMFLRLGSKMPVFGKVMMQSGWPIEVSSRTFLSYLERDIELAMADGSFDKMPKLVAANLVIGSMLGGLSAMLHEETASDYADLLTLRILLSLGMNRDAAAQAILVPIPELPLRPTGLIGEILKVSAIRA
jgi:hypothetical protein